MIEFLENIQLSRFSNYKIGGPASFFFEAGNAKEVMLAVRKAGDLNLPIFILGGGTNLLISDKGFDGLVLKADIRSLYRDGQCITVGAGILMSELLNFAAENGLSGLEWAGGLPGTVGGAVRGNAGCFGGETKDSILEVQSFDVLSNRILNRNNAECDFSYRSSVFKEKNGDEIILSVKLALKNGNYSSIKTAIDEKINYRLTKHPMEYPNIGSIFKNVDLNFFSGEYKKILAKVVKKDPFPVVPTAYLISESGLKGTKHGGAMISEKHPNFIVNFNGAKSDDVEFLITIAKEKIFNMFGVRIEEEVQRVGAIRSHVCAK